MRRKVKDFSCFCMDIIDVRFELIKIFADTIDTNLKCGRYKNRLPVASEASSFFYFHFSVRINVRSSKFLLR